MSKTQEVLTRWYSQKIINRRTFVYWWNRDLFTESNLFFGGVK